MRRASGAAHAAVAVAQGASLCAFAERWEKIRGFPLDDAWIHQVVARTFAQTGTLGYAPGQHGAGATSYLWAALLAVDHRFLHVEPSAYALALNAAFAIGAGQCLLRLLVRARPEVEDAGAWTIKSAAVVVLAAFGGNWLWFAFSGMEASLVAFLSLAAIAAWAEGRALVAGALAGALALTRPETALLGPMLVVASLARGRREAVRVAAPWATAVAAYVGTNLVATGGAAPLTLGGRRWMWFDPAAGLSHGWLVAGFVEEWAARLRNYTLGTSSMIAFWIGAGLAALGVVRLARLRDAGVRAALAWAALHVAAYVALLPTPGHGGRYQPLVPLFFLACLAHGAVTLVDDALRVLRASARARLVAAVASLAPWGALVGVGVRDWRHDHAMAVAHIRATELALGPMIDALPDGARVASFDIGGSGWSAKRPIVDAGGLSDRRAAAYLATGTIWKYLAAADVAYLILPSAYTDDAPEPFNLRYRLGLADDRAMSLERVGELSSPPAVWAPGVKATWNASPRQVLFRVRFTGEDAPAPAPPRATAGVDDPERLLRARSRVEIDHALAALAARVRVGVRIASAAPRAAPDGAWRIDLGPWGVAVDAPAPFTPEDAAAVAAQVQPYVDAHNLAGGALIALHGVARATRRTLDAGFFPALPAVPEPGAALDFFGDSWRWGGPAALAIVALGLLARQRSTR